MLLSVTVDSNLTFENHISNICKRASQKLNALARVAPYMNKRKRKLIMKSFVTSQFGYCPLIWMFHRRRLNNKINSIHQGIPENKDPGLQRTLEDPGPQRTKDCRGPRTLEDPVPLRIQKPRPQTHLFISFEIHYKVKC